MEKDLDKLERELWGNKVSYVRHRNENKHNYWFYVGIIVVILLISVALFEIGSERKTKCATVIDGSGECTDMRGAKLSSASVGELRVEVVGSDSIGAESESEGETKIKT